MNRVLIITLGFDEKFAIRAITMHGLSKGDKIVLLTGPLVERTEKAASYVREFLNKYYPWEAEVELVVLPIEDFYETTSKVVELLKKFSRVREIVVNLSGGMRIVILALFTATLFLGLENLKVEAEAEDSSTYITMDPKPLKSLISMEELGVEKKEVLRVLASETKRVSVVELAAKFGRDVSTIRRHVNSLEEKGLLIVRKRKPLYVEGHPVLKIAYTQSPSSQR